MQVKFRLGWIGLGLRAGIVTTNYPRRRDTAAPPTWGAVELAPEAATPERAAVVAAVCPSGALRYDGAALTLDRGRCVLCGRCATAAGELARITPEVELATTAREPQRLTIIVRRDRDATALPEVERAALPGQPGRLARLLRRSVHIRHLDSGSDGAIESEIAALTNPFYDMQRLGLFFTPSPRHADILLVTGAVTRAMARPLLTTYMAMPEPKLVVAAGTDACSGGLYGAGEATVGGVDRVVPVAVYIPGDPPSPLTLLHGLLLAVGRRPPAAWRSGVVPARDLAITDREVTA